MRPLTRALALIALLAATSLGACRARAVSPSGILSGVQPPRGWERSEVRAYGHDNLYDLVDGQAGSYFAYALQGMAVARFHNAEGAVLEADLWHLATPADAYGLLSVNCSGSPAAIGNGGDAEPGRRLAWWQDRYYVQVWARQELPDAEIATLARVVEAALPSGGQRPALVDRLPPELQGGRGPIFFHEEVSLQSELWLGGSNLLGLGPTTDGVLARLPLDGAPAWLLLVQYPNEQEAAAALGALQAAQPADLSLARGRGRLLAAVFGQVAGTAPTSWVEQVLR